MYPASGIHASSGGKPYLYPAGGIPASSGGKPYLYPAGGIHAFSGGLLIPYYGNARGCVLHQTLGHLSLCGYPVAETVTGFLDKYLVIS